MALLRHLVLILAGILMIYPLLWMVVSSLRPADEIFQNPGLFPVSLNFDNYIQAGPLSASRSASTS